MIDILTRLQIKSCSLIEINKINEINKPIVKKVYGREIAFTSTNKIKYEWVPCWYDSFSLLTLSLGSIQMFSC